MCNTVRTTNGYICSHLNLIYSLSQMSTRTSSRQPSVRLIISRYPSFRSYTISFYSSQKRMRATVLVPLRLSASTPIQSLDSMAAKNSKSCRRKSELCSSSIYPVDIISYRFLPHFRPSMVDLTQSL